MRKMSAIYLTIAVTIGVIGVSSSSYAENNNSSSVKAQEDLAKAYAECDKLLVIPKSSDEVDELFLSADRVSKCKDKSYKEIYSYKNNTP